MKFFICSPVISLLLVIGTTFGFLIENGWIKKLLPSQLDFKLNSTLTDSIFSCLEDEGYQGLTNYVNCHLFCSSCQEGFGKCISTGGQNLCICQCQNPVKFHKECRSIQKYCRTEELDPDPVMKSCQAACTNQGFSDGALCGLDNPPIALPTCTCLCPKISLN